MKSSSELETPDWLKDMQISAETGEEISAVSQSADLPVWLQDSDAEVKPSEVEGTSIESVAETPEPVETIPTDQPVVELPEDQVEIHETVLTISDKPEEEIPETVLPSAEEFWKETAEVEGVSGEASQVSSEMESTESILADESAAAAAAAIGIPLFAERASQSGVTKSLPPLTASQIQGEDETELPEEMAGEEVESAAEVPDATDVIVSDALESIMLPEETIPSEIEEVEVEAVATEEEETAEVAELEESTETVTPVITEEVAEEVIPDLTEAVQPEPVVEVTSKSASEVSDEEEVPSPVEAEEPETVSQERVEEIAVTDAIPEDLPEVDYSVLFSNAQNMVKAGDYVSAQPALNNLITSEQKLDDIIALVQEALNRDPTDYNLLLTLGDAYGRSGKLQSALDVYTKAEEYLQ